MPSWRRGRFREAFGAQNVQKITATLGRSVLRDRKIGVRWDCPQQITAHPVRTALMVARRTGSEERVAPTAHGVRRQSAPSARR